MQLDFFNTIHLKGEELKQAKETCNKQEERILGIMKGAMTPFEVLEVYNGIYDPIPITSCRRAMTSLTDKGKLEMLDEMKVERYNKKNHLWRKK